MPTDLDEVWRHTIDLWKLGGKQGKQAALAYLESLGWDSQEAQYQLLAAIKIYNPRLLENKGSPPTRQPARTQLHPRKPAKCRVPGHYRK